MVSFSCEGCGDVLTKKKLDGHRNQCRGATFTCLDCMVHFQGLDYRGHTQCISEAQKYQGHLYRPEKDKQNTKGRGEHQKAMISHTLSQAVIPRGAYVEDDMEGDERHAVAVIDVPPKAPTPPPAPGTLMDNVNVFDFLVADATASETAQAAQGRKRLHHATPLAKGDSQLSQYSQYSQHSNASGAGYIERGWAYGNAPLQPTFERYKSWNDLADSQLSQDAAGASSFVTPAPKERRKDKKDKRYDEKSGSKRKRNVEDLDLSSMKRPISRDEHMIDAPATAGRTLHTGLTGGLSKLITDPEFYEDRIDAGPTPISPLKRSKRDKETREDTKEERRKSSFADSWNGSKTSSTRPANDKHRRMRSVDKHRYAEKSRRRERDDSVSSEDRTRVPRRKAVEFHDRSGSVQPTSTNQIVSYNSRAELFMSFINKGPESERGCSINKALKRYHRERDVRGDEKEDEDKELWKSLRLRRNSRGEIVLFT